MTKDEALTLALEILKAAYVPADLDEQREKAITELEALAQPEQKPILQDIEQYRLQMAGISTAALGYWKEGDGILPDYDTVALRDVAKLYSKYDALYKARWPAQPEQEGERDETLEFEKALHNLIEKICPGLDSGDILADSKTALEALAQPERPWVGLTDEELAELSASGLVLWGLWRAIEAKLKEKNA